MIMRYSEMNYYEAQDYCRAYGGNVPNNSDPRALDFFVKVTITFLLRLNDHAFFFSLFFICRMHPYLRSYINIFMLTHSGKIYTCIVHTLQIAIFFFVFVFLVFRMHTYLRSYIHIYMLTHSDKIQAYVIHTLQIAMQNNTSVLSSWGSDCFSFMAHEGSFSILPYRCLDGLKAITCEVSYSNIVRKLISRSRFS